MIRFTILAVPSGSVILACTPRGVSRVILTARRGREALALARRELPEGQQVRRLLPELEKDLRAYFAGKRTRFHAHPDLTGLTPFHQEVLRACARIPYGQTMTYRELAESVGRPNAARAIGGAMARNPIPIIIPCHRVITSQGALGGYSAEQGVTLKRRLLEMETRAARR